MLVFISGSINSGKTTTSKLLAEKLGAKFINVDDLNDITIAVSAYILKRNKVGKLGIALLASLPLWLIFSLLP